jgi:xylulokinase
VTPGIPSKRRGKVVYFLGLDIGTTGLKAGIVDEEGSIVASAYWKTEHVSSEPGRMEQDVDEILLSTLKITGKVLERSKVKNGEIGAVVLDGQMAGIVGIDKAFNPITGLDFNLDLQSERYNLYMHEKYGDLLARVTCGSPLNGQKVLKWKRDYPAVYKKVHKWVTLSGYVAGRMAGLKGSEAFIDHTLLAFFGFESARDLEWSCELCKQLDVDMEKLPAVVPSHKVIGGIDARSAEASGLKQGTPVLAGAGDQAASLIGAGVIVPGLVVDGAGSSTLLFVCVDGFVPDLKNRTVMYIPSVARGVYYAFTYINGGGMSLPWLVDDILGKATGSGQELHAELTGLASQLPPGSGGLLFIPYFGGRQCPFDVQVRGGWLGLNWGHRREHLYRAVLESIAYDNYLGFTAIRELFPDIGSSEILATGGGSKNRLWNQIKADVLGLRYRKLKGFEYAVRGCGMIGACGTGLYGDFTEALYHMKDRSEGEIIAPDMKNNGVYSRYCEIFKNALSADLTSILHGLQEI